MRHSVCVRGWVYVPAHTRVCARAKRACYEQRALYWQTLVMIYYHEAFYTARGNLHNCCSSAFSISTATGSQHWCYQLHLNMDAYILNVDAYNYLKCICFDVLALYTYDLNHQ
jgi:hypothetical protein